MQWDLITLSIRFALSLAFKFRKEMEGMAGRFVNRRKANRRRQSNGRDTAVL